MVIRSHMTRYVRSYLAYILFFIGFLGFTMWSMNYICFKYIEGGKRISIYEIVLSLLIVIGCITIVFAKSRLTSIIALGAVGYTVSLLFVVFRAPDLALTQLVIETISVALFLLAFYHLPKKFRHPETRRFKLNNALIAIGVGLVVTLLAISSYSTKLFDFCFPVLC